MDAKSRTVLAQAKVLFQKQDYKGVVALLDQALKDDLSRYKLIDSRGAAHFKLENYPEALADAKRQIQLDPGCAQGYKRAANVYKAKRLWSNAIKVLEAGLKRCKAKDRKDLEDTLASLQATVTEGRLSPISLLPVELLLVCFRLLPEAARIRCTHVSRRWRRIIHQDPQCWDECVLFGTHRFAHKMQLWRAKLNGRPLRTLRLNSPKGWYPQWEHEMPDLSQLKRFTIGAGLGTGTLPDHQLSDFLDSIREIAAYSLVDLNLHLDGVPRDANDLLTFLATMPNLKFCHFRFGTKTLPLVESSVEDVVLERLERLSVVTPIDALRPLGNTGPTRRNVKLPRLRELKWHCRRMEFDIWHTDAPSLVSLDAYGLGWGDVPEWEATYEHLENLVLGYGGGVFLDRARLPNLRSLHLHAYKRLALESALLERAKASPLVTSFHASRINLSNHQLVAEVFKHWVHLTDINLANTWLDGALVPLLVDLPLPLEHFGLSNCETLRASPVVQLVQTHKSLKALTLIDCPNMDVEGLKWLRKVVPQVKHRFQSPEEAAKMKR